MRWAGERLGGQCASRRWVAGSGAGTSSWTGSRGERYRDRALACRSSFVGRPPSAQHLLPQPTPPPHAAPAAHTVRPGSCRRAEQARSEPAVRSPHVRAISGSPSAPSCPAPSARLASWPSTCAGPGTPRHATCSRPSTRSAGRRCGRTRSRLLGDLSPERLVDLAADQEFVARVRAPRLISAPTFPNRAGTRASTATRRLDRLLLAPSSASRRCCRSTRAVWASWPATTSRAPPTSACRSSASGCSTRAATSSSRCPGRVADGGLPGARPGRAAADPAARGRRHALRGRPWTCRAGAVCVAHVWKADVGRVPLLLLDSDVPANDEAARSITDRLYGGGGEHRLQQEMLLGIGGVRALRLWSRLTGAPAPEVFHTNEGHAGFLGLERIRELDGRGGLTFDEAHRGGTRRDGLHHAHPGARRHRPVRHRPDRALLRRLPARSAACRWTACSRSAPRTTRAARPASSTWP